MRSIATRLFITAIATLASTDTLLAGDSGWGAGFHRAGADGAVRAAISFDGQLIIAGRFAAANHEPASRVAAWNGSTFYALGDGLGADQLNSDVRALAVYEGQLIAGGYIRYSGDAPLENIARWTGSSWQTLGIGSDLTGGTDNRVASLVVHDGDLIAGGYFSHAGGVATHRVARWDGLAWHAMDGGAFTAVVGSLASLDGFVYASDGARIYVWDGTAWSVHSDPGFVQALAVYDGEIIAAGQGFDLGGASDDLIARWDASTTSWQPLAAGLGGSVAYALGVVDGALVAAGRFDTAGAVSANNIAKWNGSTWSSLGNGLGRDLLALAEHDGATFAGGTFTTGADEQTDRIARFDGTNWLALGEPGLGVASGPVDMTDLGSTVLMSGALAGYGHEVFAGLVSWDGVDWAPFGDPPVPGTLDSHFSRAVLLNDDVVVCRDDGALVSRWTGAGWDDIGFPQSFDEVSGWLDGSAFLLEPYQGGLVCAGWFEKMNDMQVDGVCHWDGSTWSPMGEGVQVEFPYALTTFNGDPVVGGAFVRSGPTIVNRIARWTGVAWQPLGDGLNDEVRELGVYGGLLIASGPFTEAGGLPASHLAAWDGSAWSEFGGGVSGGDDPQVTAFGIHDGDLFIAGTFERAGDVDAAGIARWTGSTWEPLGSGLTHPDGASAKRLLSWQGRLLVSGSFTHAGGIAAANLSTWQEPVVSVPPLAGAPSPYLAVRGPHPTGNVVEIGYEVTRPGRVRLSVHDVTGRQIALLVNRWSAAGMHAASWSPTRGGRAATGVFFVRYAMPDGVESVKVVRQPR